MNNTLNFLPEGFKEFIEFVESNDLKKFKAKDIQKGLSHQYNFSSGKISGIINRAEEKKLITKIGRGLYQYNGLSLFGNDSTPLSFKDKINREIIQTVKRINEIIAQNVSDISIEEFENTKNIINKLIELEKELSK